MANLKADASLRWLGEHFSEKFDLSLGIYPQTIWKGCPMVVDQSVPGVVQSMEGLTLIDGDVFVGIAAERMAVAVTDTVAPKIEIYTWPSIVGFKNNAAFTDTDLGKPVWMSDTGTLTLSGGAYPRIGKLFRVKDGYAFVALESPYIIDVP